jgi:hypothetical protein
MPTQFDYEIKQLVSIIRDANVRDGVYAIATQEIIRSGATVRPALLALLSDSEAMVRNRAKELLKIVPTD